MKPFLCIVQLLGEIIATVFVSEISISFARQFGSMPELTAGLARLLMRAWGLEYGCLGWGFEKGDSGMARAQGDFFFS